ncbi:NAD+ synthase [Acidithiobacillus sulfuriphilus]|uniref:Glutamine-dependent NAD(+) synthetase n=2 Tax=Acidithiobacillus sulfuriphilus TaxID=1867749 RepID=A0A3M8RUX9_9PROT|nr:NAD+ synthase [Acidithiobacillus sulfuriphilus]RNF71856.1 NAD+ synthase [Acidithiobacillus sulfuriphilus]
MRIALAQVNCRVGDIVGNADLLLREAHRAQAEGADLLITPELALSGYPPEDLLLRDDFLAVCDAQLQRLAGAAPLPVLVGHPQRVEQRLYNSASLLREGRVESTYHKHCLPNYDVFDEMRYFTPGTRPLVFACAGLRCGVVVCEDVWWGPAVAQAAQAEGAEILLILNASPYHVGKQRQREDAIAGVLARQLHLPMVYVNLVGGQDELVFDGQSFAVDHDGLVVLRSVPCREDLAFLDIHKEAAALRLVPGQAAAPLLDEVEEVYQALRLGVRDYTEKNGFSGVVLGLSGGVDSALTLAVAVDALGPQRVHALIMPSRYTAAMSMEDAQEEARRLGVRTDVVSIDNLFTTYLDTLAPIFAGLPADTTEENLQARIRAALLMAYSNKFGHLLLTTGNKSEIAVGYATLYGDMAGGFAIIKDCPKTLVYRLARYCNGIAPVIPERVLTRAPSAELAPNQRDQDSLPPYEILDAIIAAYVEHDRSAAEIIAQGFAAETVTRVLRLIDRAEYKRRQAAPGVRISPRAFGKDRRYPITNGYTP